MQQQTLLPSSAVMQQAPDTSFDFAPASSASAIHVYQDTSLLQQDFAMQLNQDVSSNEVSEDQDQVHDSDNGFDDGSGNNDDELDDERSFDIDVLGDDEVFVNIGGHQSGRRIQFRSSNPFANSSPELQSGDDDDGFEEDSSPFY
ncbi:hypothetical protein MP228_002697 [Amoeboaphelidium protococcarum]|nr:hypothetical protein MP228_002697 [Amoeboaphelidium protococcarum]